MANEIKDKIVVASTAFTIGLGALASSTAGVGRQSTMINNESSLAQDLLIFAQITTGTSPAADSTIAIYGIRGDDHTANLRDDGAGASDAALTVFNAQLLGIIRTDSVPTSNKAYTKSFLFHRPGASFGVAVVQSTTVNLHATAGNHIIRYVSLNPNIAAA